MSIATDNMRGAGLMSLAMAAYVINDACMKALSDELPLSEALFLRGAVTTVLIGGWIWHRGVLRLHLARADLLLVCLRTIGEVAAAFFFLSALFHMPLANATAIMQALPLTVTLAGAWFLGEALGWRRILAIGIGLTGVLLIVRPGPEGFNIYTLYVLAAVVSVTLRDVVTRGLSGHVSSLMVALWASIGVMLLGAALAPGEGWVWPGWVATMQLIGASLFLIAAYILGIIVMRAGDVGFIAPFRYTSLIWALILGLVLFGEWPDLVTLAGAAIVVSTGAFMFHRERQLARRARI